VRLPFHPLKTFGPSSTSLLSVLFLPLLVALDVRFDVREEQVGFGQLLDLVYYSRLAGHYDDRHCRFLPALVPGRMLLHSVDDLIHFFLRAASHSLKRLWLRRLPTAAVKVPDYGVLVSHTALFSFLADADDGLACRQASPEPSVRTREGGVTSAYPTACLENPARDRAPRG